jgi:TRAP transporter TAXI family solute receptor
MTLHPNPNFFVVLRSSGIKDYAELRGKRVHIGAAGGGSEVSGKMILEGCGLTYKDVKPVFLGFGQAQDALLEGDVEAACLFTPLTNKVNAQKQIDILSLSHKQMDEIIKKSPCFTKYEFSPNYFKGVDYPVWALDYGVQLICREDADPAMVYNLTKTLIENVSDLGTVYAPAKIIDKNWAAKYYGVPFHPGAAKYYKEIGVIQ